MLGAIGFAVYERLLDGELTSEAWARESAPAGDETILPAAVALSRMMLDTKCIFLQQNSKGVQTCFVTLTAQHGQHSYRRWERGSVGRSRGQRLAMTDVPKRRVRRRPRTPSYLRPTKASMAQAVTPARNRLVHRQRQRRAEELSEALEWYRELNPSPSHTNVVEDMAGAGDGAGAGAAIGAGGSEGILAHIPAASPSTRLLREEAEIPAPRLRSPVKLPPDPPAPPHDDGGTVPPPVPLSAATECGVTAAAAVGTPLADHTPLRHSFARQSPLRASAIAAVAAPQTWHGSAVPPPSRALTQTTATATHGPVEARSPKPSPEPHLPHSQGQLADRNPQPVPVSSPDMAVSMVTYTPATRAIASRVQALEVALATQLRSALANSQQGPNHDQHMPRAASHLERPQALVAAGYTDVAEDGCLAAAAAAADSANTADQVAREVSASAAAQEQVHSAQSQRLRESALGYVGSPERQHSSRAPASARRVTFGGGSRSHQAGSWAVAGERSGVVRSLTPRLDQSAVPQRRSPQRTPTVHSPPPTVPAGATTPHITVLSNTGLGTGSALRSSGGQPLSRSNHTASRHSRSTRSSPPSPVRRRLPVSAGSESTRRDGRRRRPASPAKQPPSPPRSCGLVSTAAHLFRLGSDAGGGDVASSAGMDIVDRRIGRSALRATAVGPPSPTPATRAMQLGVRWAADARKQVQDGHAQPSRVARVSPRSHAIAGADAVASACCGACQATRDTTLAPTRAACSAAVVSSLGTRSSVPFWPRVPQHAQPRSAYATIQDSAAAIRAHYDRPRSSTAHLAVLHELDPLSWAHDGGRRSPRPTGPGGEHVLPRRGMPNRAARRADAPPPPQATTTPAGDAPRFNARAATEAPQVARVSRGSTQRTTPGSAHEALYAQASAAKSVTAIAQERLARRTPPEVKVQGAPSHAVALLRAEMEKRCGRRLMKWAYRMHPDYSTPARVIAVCSIQEIAFDVEVRVVRVV